MVNPAVRTLAAKAAAELDGELMGTGAFSIDQLMELAGLAVAQAVYREYPPRAVDSRKVLVLVGPGNNGGDGLVAARHLKLWGAYEPVVYFPKMSKSNSLYGRLLTQLRDLQVQEVDSLDSVKTLLGPAGGVRLILDALFGFSFKPPIRPPFDDLLEHLASGSHKIPPIVSVDIPSGWDVDSGPLQSAIDPHMLISLTAPKPCARFFQGDGKVHYLGGRFISRTIAEKYQIEGLMDLYKGDDMVVKL